MKISPKAMRAALSDPEIMSAVKRVDVKSLNDKGIDVFSDMIVLKNESNEKTGMIDHRSVKWSEEEVERRYFETIKEINVYGTGFAKLLLSQHQKMIETRSDFNNKQISGFRKVIICLWHNIKVVKGLLLDDNVRIGTQ